MVEGENVVKLKDLVLISYIFNHFWLILDREPKPSQFMVTVYKGKLVQKLPELPVLKFVPTLPTRKFRAQKGILSLAILMVLILCRVSSYMIVLMSL